MFNIKKIIIYVLVIALAASGVYVLFLRKTIPANAKIIPRNAAFVVSFNLVSLAQKADIKKVRKMNFADKLMQEMSKEDDDMKSFIDKALDNPAITGIDFRANAFIYLTEKTDEKAPNGGFTIKLSEPDAFERMLKKMIKKDNFNLKDEGKYKYVLPDYNSCIAWNNDVALIFFNFNEGMKKEMDQIMTGTDATGRLVSSENFTSFLKSSHDIGLYMDGSNLADMIGSFYKSQQISGFQPGGKGIQDQMESIKKIYKGMNMQALMTFDNDKVEIKSRMYYKDHSQISQSKELISKSLDKTILNYIAPSGVIAAASVSFNPKPVIDSLLKSMPLKPAIDEITASLNLTGAILETVFSGDFAIALTDIKPIVHRVKVYDYSMMQNYYQNMPPSAGSPFSGMTPPAMPETYRYDTTLTPVFVATIGLTNQKLAESILSKTTVGKKGYYSLTTPSGYNFYFIPVKPGITVTNDSESAELLAKNGSFKPEFKPGVEDLLSNHAMGLYIDLDPGDLKETTKNNIIKKNGPQGFDRFKDVMSIFKDVKVKADYDGGDFRLNMRNTDQNSLFTIINHIDVQTSR